MSFPAFPSAKEFFAAWATERRTLRDNRLDDPVGFLRACIVAFRDGAASDDVSDVESQLETLSMLAETLWLELYRPDTPEDLAVECVEACGALMRRWCSSLDSYSSPCHGFWAQLLHPLPPGVTILATALGEAFRDALLAQLEVPNKECQFGALHGLNHLGDPATVGAIERLLAATADPEVREYAEKVRRFAAP